FITENDIFFRMSKISSSQRKRKSNIKSEKIENFIELKVGDIVVHEVYGIGKFLGIEQKENNGVKKDYIKVAYKGGDSIYVPISQMDKVQKYIGSSSDKIALTQLGSTQWKKQKQKAKKAAEEIAKYLVELYAQRENQKGHSFSKDTVWQREFEALFPFEETQDQLKSIKDIKRDMESIRPMDRLICGDVGYGKTEVAIRGIFKACMDGKQVAFLVPTTILAQQHYKTISERFENFPIKVDVLSRFKSKKEQELVVENVKSGEIDVLVGTHRILSKDVSFKDLGMLVIDEEQRFGVKDKEKIKQLKSNIDVLTLTATPIPRTLNMSLSGIRDMSVLQQPPNDRLSVITYVTEAREGIIMDAIEREVSRGGQVFFVYNSVENIDKMKTTIERLVPNVKIGVAHGQMTPAVLEDIMIDYLEKKYDVLLCTTIIETGMDISNANTIIVYNADKMGLSQLYQLRGRVGRSSRQAYAYLMYEKDKVLTEVAQKRLKAIRDFTEFGSGFKVAMMDLEIRGSGNLLGETQSGHIEEVGYDLYIKMLNESFKKLKGIQEEERVSTEVYIGVNAYIPDTYIEDEIQKMEIYKKIASISSKEDYFEIQAEIEDRYSNIPYQVENLLKISSIRSLGEKIGIEKISQKNKQIIYESSKDKVIQTLKSTKEENILLEVI
ncbi:MAG: transcription-repair coupling factor, partial [Peptostreptococcaceae bacterium]|nr:transcription-repair coupling factor [Peptostreptococcaceae bacterium]